MTAVTGTIRRLVPVAPPARHAPARSTSHSQLCATNGCPAVSQLNGSVDGMTRPATIESPIARCHQASGSTCGRHVATHAATSTTAAREPPSGPSSRNNLAVGAQFTGPMVGHPPWARCPVKLRRCIDTSPSSASSSCPAPPASSTRSSGPASSSSSSATRPRPSRRSSPASSAAWRSGPRSAAGSPTGSARRSGCTACWRSCSSSSCWSTPLTFGLINEVYRGIYPALEGTPFLALARLVLAVLALAPATIMMGATFPALVRHFDALVRAQPGVRAAVLREHDGRRGRHALWPASS